jgi:hypothetical protein
MQRVEAIHGSQCVSIKIEGGKIVVANREQYGTLDQGYAMKQNKSQGVTRDNKNIISKFTPFSLKNPRSVTLVSKWT